MRVVEILQSTHTYGIDIDYLSNLVACEDAKPYEMNITGMQSNYNQNKKSLIGVGLVNDGNTCYVNAALQAISHMPTFIQWLNTIEYAGIVVPR